MGKARTKRNRGKTAEEITGKSREEIAEQAYQDYIVEREHLSKYEQANYDNYEKAILTLSAAFLAFSVSFLGLFRNRAPSGAQLPPLISHQLLVTSWISFASSIVFLLVSFLVNAMANRSQVIELENRLAGELTSEKLNRWDKLGYVLTALSGLAFVAGLILLLVFSARNIHSF